LNKNMVDNGKEENCNNTNNFKMLSLMESKKTQQDNNKNDNEEENKDNDKTQINYLMKTSNDQQGENEHKENKDGIKNDIIDLDDCKNIKQIKYDNQEINEDEIKLEVLTENNKQEDKSQEKEENKGKIDDILTTLNNKEHVDLSLETGERDVKDDSNNENHMKNENLNNDLKRSINESSIGIDNNYKRRKTVEINDTKIDPSDKENKRKSESKENDITPQVKPSRLNHINKTIIIMFDDDKRLRNYDHKENTSLMEESLHSFVGIVEIDMERTENSLKKMIMNKFRSNPYNQIIDNVNNEAFFQQDYHLTRSRKKLLLQKRRDFEKSIRQNPNKF
jgi:hypothetical protein